MSFNEFFELVIIALAKQLEITTSEAECKAEPFKSLLVQSHFSKLSPIETACLLERSLAKENHLTVNQMVYLKKVRASMSKLHSSFQDLNKLWTEEEDGIELNDYLRTMYPFDKSFDALTLNVEHWRDDVIQKFKLEGLN